MILVFVSMMIGTVTGQTLYPNSLGSHSSPSLYNIIDGRIPSVLSSIKGCKRDLQLTDVKPSSYVPISCADIRYSVYDDHTFILTSNDVSVQRKYTDNLSEYVDGVCKIQVSDMPDQTVFGLYENGKTQLFLNRYGYCDDGELKDPILTEVVSNVSISCGDEDKDHILTKTECSVYLGFEVEEIFDKTKPYGCVDGKFNSFDRSKDLEDVEAEAKDRMDIRIQDLIDEFADIESYLDSADITDVPEHHHYEPTIEIESGSAYNILKIRLQNIRDQIKSVHLKQAYYNSLVDYVTQQQATITEVRKKYDRAIEISDITKKYEDYDLTQYKELGLQYIDGNNTRLENKYNEIYTNAITIKTGLTLANELVNLQQLMDVYDIYKNYMDDHYHRDKSTASKLQSWCNSLEEHRELTKSIGCIPSLDFNLHCVPDWASYRYTEPTPKYDAYGNVYYTDIGTCTNIRPGGSITNCPTACDPDRTPNTIGKNYSHLEWNNPKSDQLAFVLLSKSQMMEEVGMVVNTTIENNAVCPYNYICDQGFSYRNYEKQIAEILWVDNQPTDQFTYRYEYGVQYDLQTSFMDYESVTRSIECAPFCFPDLPSLPVEVSSDVTFSLTERQPTKRQANADIIFSDIVSLEQSSSDTYTLMDLYKELVEQNLSCESLGCQELCYKVQYNSVEDAVLSCSEMCVLDKGFSQYWDDSPVRQTSRIISNRRHECRCGTPKTELECVMSNNEWKSDIYTTQYSYVPRNPVKRKSTTYSDRYLFCPVSHCTDGFVDQICNKHLYLECNVGTECSDVTARLIVNGSPQSFEDNAYHMSEGQFFFGYNLAGDRVDGVVTNLDGDILGTGIVGSWTPTLDMWNNREESTERTLSITDFHVVFEDSTDACEVGHWYEKSLFRDGCIAPGDTPFCKNGFVDEVCMCKDVSCEPGYYCTKQGECKPWVSKDKKVLHTRYNYLSQQ